MWRPGRVVVVSGGEWLSNATFLIVVLIIAMLAVTTVLAIFAVRAARRLSQWTFPPAVVRVVVAVVAPLVVAVRFILGWGTTTTESYTEPAPMTGEFKDATPQNARHGGR